MGAKNPAAHEKVFANPKTVPTRPGAISGTIGISPPDEAPMVNIVKIRPITITSALPDNKGILNKNRAGPIRAKGYIKDIHIT